MRHKLTWKLSSYFLIILVVFVGVVSLVFNQGYKRAITSHYEEMLRERADAISASLATYMQQQNKATGHRSRMHNRQNDYEQYLEVVDDIAGSDVWIINEDYKIVTSGHMGNSQTNNLPAIVRENIDKVLQGETVVLQGFSEVLNTQAVTVGSPVRDENGDILAAVLLHGAVSGIEDQAASAMKILLWGGSIALLLAMLMAWLLSRRFVRPLILMEKHSNALIEGDYSAKLALNQNDEIGYLAHTLDVLARRLDDLEHQRLAYDTMRNEFFADISHELRTPITVLRGLIEGVHDGLYETDEVMDTLRIEIAQLQKLVDDVLELTRLNRTEFKLEYEMFLLDACLKDASRSMRIKAREKQLHIETSIDPSQMIYGDYARIRQVLIIVLDNAIKFSKENGTIYLNGKQNNNTYEIVIRDQGVGFLEDMDPFVRYEQANESHKQGLGLGLSIAKRIMDLHEASIVLSNNDGAEVTLSFKTHEKNSD